MIGKKINQLATELAPASTDLTIIGNPTTGVSKKITLAQLGAIFSGAVSFYTNLAAFPTIGTTDVIFCAKDTQKLYLWSGSAYVEVFPSQALLDTYQLRSEKGNANGYASLDSSGKVPISQLPSSIMEYKGTWSAATNTPTLANGTGDTGDVYLCNAAGTVNFGAGPLTFAVGDYVIYSGSIWQRSSGAVGTVTSVAASITGNAIGITGSPVTTSGTLALAFAGTSAQYVNGAGNLTTFPSIISQAQNIVSEVYNNTGATLTKGTIVYINGGQGNLPTVTKALATGDSTSAQTYGIVQADITNMNNGYVVLAGRLIDLDTQAYSNGTQLYLSGTTAGTWTSTKPYAPTHLVYVGIVVRAHPTQGVVEVKIQNGYELDEIHNVSAQTPTNNDGLFWEASTSLWKNKSISTILGGTPVIGSGTTNFVSKFTASSTIGSSQIWDNGTSVLIGTTGTLPGVKVGIYSSTQRALEIVSTNSNALFVQSPAAYILTITNGTWTSQFTNTGRLDLAGDLLLNTIANATTDTDKFLVSDSGVIKYRTGAELLSDIGGASASGYVPYTGATTNVNLGTNDLYARSLYVEGTASYQSGLVIKQISGFNFVTGAYTQLAPSGIYDLNVVHNQTNGTRRIYQLSVAGLQDGDNFQYLVPRKNGTFAMTSDIPSLTGYVSGSGTTNYLPKFTGASTIGNSLVFDNGTTVSIGNTAGGTGYALEINTNASTPRIDLIDNSTYTGTFKTNGGTVTIGNNSANPLVFTTGGTERMRLNASGNLGLGVTPQPWTSVHKVIQFGAIGSIETDNDAVAVSNNRYFDGTNRYSTNDFASIYVQVNGGHVWYSAPSGTAGGAISFTQAMTLNASGNLSIGNTNNTYKLDVTGTGRFTSDLSLTNSFNSILYLTNTATNGKNWNLQSYLNGEFYIGISGVANYLTIASTGAATFSSSVTAASWTSAGTNASPYFNEGIILGQGNNQSKIQYGNSFASSNGTWMKFVVNGSAAANTPIDVMTLKYDGNVGIGTTSPTSLLHLKGYVPTLTFEASGYVGDTWQIRTAASGSNSTFNFYNATQNSYPLNITGSGNVGIGTTSPGYNLQVVNSASGVAVAAFQNTLTTGYSGAHFLNNAGTLMGHFGYGNASVSGPLADLVYFGSIASKAVVFTTNDTERMRITSGGRVCINTTTVNNGAFLNIGSSGSSRGDDLMTIFNPATYGIRFLSATGGGSPNTSVAHMLLGNDGTTGRSINASGTINAAGLDYAEYMTKAIEDNIYKGDIIGIDKNGLLTNIFEDAISFAVKSTDPSYVGGDNWGKKLEGAELEKARQKVDRVAFSGQVPCNVLNAKVGDYIIPINVNGKIKGQAITDPTLEQYRISVGKVWKVMEDGRAWIAVKIG